MEKKTIDVEGMLKAGPYSHAVEAGGFVFLSGQVPIDQGVPIRDDVAAATALVFENVKKVLAAAGTSLEKVVKVTVFLRDMGDFASMNEVYGRYFTSNHPARSCVAVKTIPLDLPVEIEVVAIR